MSPRVSCTKLLGQSRRSHVVVQESSNDSVLARDESSNSLGSTLQSLTRLSMLPELFGSCDFATQSSKIVPICNADNRGCQEDACTKLLAGFLFRIQVLPVDVNLVRRVPVSTSSRIAIYTGFAHNCNMHEHILHAILQFPV